MNIFRKILQADFDATSRLGNPLGFGSGPFLARMNLMAQRTGGRGFRTPRQEPRTDAQGKTRGQRRREVRARLFGGAA